MLRGLSDAQSIYFINTFYNSSPCLMPIWSVPNWHQLDHKQRLKWNAEITWLNLLCQFWFNSCRVAFCSLHFARTATGVSACVLCCSCFFLCNSYRVIESSVYCTRSGAKWCDTTSRSKFLLLLLISDGSSCWKNFLLLIQEKLFSKRCRNKGDILCRWSVTSKKFLSVFRAKDNLSVRESG